MSEISRASKQSAPTHTSRQSAPSHVSRQSTRLRQEPPAFTESDLPQHTRRRRPHTAGDVPLPTSLDDANDAGGAQAFQPPITSTEPARSQSGLSPSPTHVASSPPPKVRPMWQARGDYYLPPDSRFDAPNTSNRQSEDPGAARAKATVSPRTVASDGAKDAPANVANFEASVREGRRTPALPSQVVTHLERYVESFRSHAARGDLADPNTSFDRTMGAVQQHLALPQQDDESDSQYARRIKAMECSWMEKPASIIRPVSSTSTTASRSSGRTARSSASVKAWHQDVFERGVLQMIHNGHMIEYNTSTVPKQDVVLEIIDGNTMAYIASKPTIQVKIPDLDDARCAPFLERFPSPTRELEEWVDKDEPSLKHAEPVIQLPAPPAVQAVKEPESFLARKTRERHEAADAARAKHADVLPAENIKSELAHIEVAKPLPEKLPVPRSDVFGRRGVLVEDEVEIPILREIKTEVLEPVQVRMARIIEETPVIVQRPRHASIHVRASQETVSPRNLKKNTSEKAPGRRPQKTDQAMPAGGSRRVNARVQNSPTITRHKAAPVQSVPVRALPIPPPSPDPDPSDSDSDGGGDTGNGNGADPGRGSGKPGHDAPVPGDGWPPPRAGGDGDGDGDDDGGDDGDDGPDDDGNDGQHDRPPVNYAKRLRRSTSVLNEIKPHTIDEFMYVPPTREAGVSVLDAIFFEIEDMVVARLYRVLNDRDRDLAKIIARNVDTAPKFTGATNDITVFDRWARDMIRWLDQTGAHGPPIREDTRAPSEADLMRITLLAQGLSDDALEHYRRTTNTYKAAANYSISFIEVLHSLFVQFVDDDSLRMTALRFDSAQYVL
ncbi:hypothetical protein BDZ89DRAFT_1126688 [Hymenopellis radicata]|nr:hypothetical protein BDZ89DRAFT_1126688 [Hymenopellis radicata]